MSAPWIVPPLPVDRPRDYAEILDHYEREAFDALPMREKAMAYVTITLAGLSLLGLLAALVIYLIGGAR